MELTEGTLLGGRVQYRQPRIGYRTGIEPVLLAASVPIRPGERLLEGGTGAGAALLCLVARAPSIQAIGVERDAGLADVARANLAQNGYAAATVETGDVLWPRHDPPYDHAIANPPWHDPGGTASVNAMREEAKRASPMLLLEWVKALAKPLRPGGTLTLLVPASATDRALAALLHAKCGSCIVYPLWPHAGEEARLTLIRGRKTGRGGCKILPGLILHDGAGFSSQTRAILWDGAPLAW